MPSLQRVFAPFSFVIGYFKAILSVIYTRYSSFFNNVRALFIKQFIRWRRSTFTLICMFLLPATAMVIIKGLDLFIAAQIEDQNLFGLTDYSSFRTGQVDDSFGVGDALDYTGPAFYLTKADGSSFDWGSWDVLAQSGSGAMLHMPEITSSAYGVDHTALLPNVTTFASTTGLEAYLASTWDKKNAMSFGIMTVVTSPPMGSFVFNKANVNATHGEFALDMVSNVTYSSSSDEYRTMSQALNILKSAFTRKVTGSATSDIKSSTSHYPMDGNNSIDIVAMIAGYFFTPLFHFLLPFTATSLVYEKEHKLRMIMRMLGLKAAEYWFVEVVFFLVLSFVMNNIFIIMGYVLDLSMFTSQDLWGMEFILFCWSVSAAGQTIFMSTLFSSERATTILAWAYTLIISIMSYVIVALEASMAGQQGWTIWWIPPIGICETVMGWGTATTSAGHPMTLESAVDPFGYYGKMAWALVASGFILGGLGVYLDRVMPTTPDTVEPFYFPFLPRTWMPVRSKVPSREKIEKNLSLSERRVQHEGKTVCDAIEMRKEGRKTLASNYGIVIADLRKSFTSFGFFKRHEVKAVAGINYAIRRNECFGLLGHNGAGKTTTVNILSGTVNASSGTAYVHGYDIKTQMGNVRNICGVCPQDDIVWPELTGAEHLNFFGRIKGVPSIRLGKEVYEGLASVRLERACDLPKHVSAYSGGMRRRLCVAIAFMGNPDVVLLDEPTTGLDPETRRGLWEIIRQKKAGRTILLTTHSMEEADALCNRLSIMKDGRVAVLGSPAALKKELGATTYSLVINCNPPRAAGVTVSEHEEIVTDNVERCISYLNSICDSLNIEKNVAGSLGFTFSASEVSSPGKPTLSEMARLLREAEGMHGYIEWGVTSPSLEDVFIKVSEEAVVDEPEFGV
ncbi:ABC transporter [Carpediemonas membranifera]|uniref:ABC transporter n=1 Tax=Carpediemonas membranifera TaxID=201153 RepID=A0A8J6B7Y4_9EUKA|nr:ABC transporter [Carpediemonas membranifera]|eukprot:KAG9396124.1 ABC transporter [Carpediemonas membranifera]